MEEFTAIRIDELAKKNNHKCILERDIDYTKWAFFLEKMKLKKISYKSLQLKYKFSSSFKILSECGVSKILPWIER